MKQEQKRRWKYVLKKNTNHPPRLIELMTDNFTERQLMEDYPACAQAVEVLKRIENERCAILTT